MGNKTLIKLPYIDTSVLQIGNKYSSYKTLANILNEPIYKGGNQRKAQLSNWECYFNYEKEGNAYIITEIYNIPLTKKRKFTNRVEQSKYVQYFENLLLLLAYDSEYSKTPENFADRKFYCSIDISLSQLYKLCGLITDIYKKDKSQYYYSIKKGETRDYDKEEIFKTIWSVSYQTVRTVLTSLNRSRLASCQKITTIKENGVTRELLSKELNILKDASNFALKQLNLQSEFQAYIRQKGHEYHTCINNFLKEQYNWTDIYTFYTITILDSDKTEEKTKLIREKIKEELTMEKIEELRKINALTFNDNYISTLNKNFQKTYDNTINGRTHGFTVYKKPDLRTDFVEYSAKYIEDFLRITENPFEEQEIQRSGIRKYVWDKNTLKEYTQEELLELEKRSEGIIKLE